MQVDWRTRNNINNQTKPFLNISVNPLFNDFPKSLIPIVNKPILAYQLEFFERSKFKEVTVITHKKFYEEIDIYVSEKFQG